MSVIEFPLINYNDVPSVLRALADQIENGDYGTALGFVYAFNNDEDEVFYNSFGPISQVEAVGLYAMAGQMLAFGESEE